MVSKPATYRIKTHFNGLLIISLAVDCIKFNFKHLSHLVSTQLQQFMYTLNIPLHIHLHAHIIYYISYTNLNVTTMNQFLLLMALFNQLTPTVSFYLYSLKAFSTLVKYDQIIHTQWMLEPDVTHYWNEWTNKKEINSPTHKHWK